MHIFFYNHEKSTVKPFGRQKINYLAQAFLIAYMIVGSTDFFDGQIARRFNQKTELVKKLDSFADLFFYVSTAWFVAVLFPEYLQPNKILLIVFFSLFFLSFVISTIFCRKPIVMYTFLLKLNGVLVYFLVLVSFRWDTTLFMSLILLIYPQYYAFDLSEKSASTHA